MSTYLCYVSHWSTLSQRSQWYVVGMCMCVRGWYAKRIIVCIYVSIGVKDDDFTHEDVSDYYYYYYFDDEGGGGNH